MSKRYPALFNQIEEEIRMEPVLEVKDLDKQFVGVHAVDHVSFQCFPGTVHVLQ